MAKYWKAIVNQWVKQLRDLAKKNTLTGVIGLKLGRTESTVYSKASEKT